MGSNGEVVLNAGDYQVPGEGPLTTDEVVKRHMQGQQSGGFSSFDGRTTFTYPRLNLTDHQRADFLDSLGPVIDAVLAENKTESV